jgi:hypothetical protein
MATRRRQATAEDLLGKPARTQEVTITVPGEKGDIELTLALKAISATAYDQLLAEHPPTKEQAAEGAGYNADSFAPAIIAAVVESPKLSPEQAAEIWTGETWSRGELRDLFMACVNLCARGLDVPFTPAG